MTVNLVCTKDSKSRQLGRNENRLKRWAMNDRFSPCKKKTANASVAIPVSGETKLEVGKESMYSNSQILSFF